MFTAKPKRYGTSSAAASREQKRQAHLETEEKNKSIPVFMFQKFGFRPQYGAMKGNIKMEGPLCPKLLDGKRTCLSRLSSGSNGTDTSAHCEVCESNYKLPLPFQRFREVAHRAYEGYLNYVESGGNIVTLDTGYSSVSKDRANNGNKSVKVLWSQKDGRNMAVIYCIDKDDDGDKTQIFADMDREELRYDASDIPPGKILAKIKAEFRNSESEIMYKKEEK